MRRKAMRARRAVPPHLIVDVGGGDGGGVSLQVLRGDDGGTSVSVRAQWWRAERRDTSGVAMATMWINRSSPKFSKSQLRMDMMNLVAAIPLLATTIRLITLVPPASRTNFSYCSIGVNVMPLQHVGHRCGRQGKGLCTRIVRQATTNEHRLSKCQAGGRGPPHARQGARGTREVHTVQRLGLWRAPQRWHRAADALTPLGPHLVASQERIQRGHPHLGGDKHADE